MKYLFFIISIVDVGAAICFLKKRKDVDSGRIGLCGESYEAYKAAISTGVYKDDINTAIMDSVPRA